MYEYDADDARSDDELTADAAFSGGDHPDHHDDERSATRPPIGCPRCGRELEYGPYGTWVCQRCPERVAIREASR